MRFDCSTLTLRSIAPWNRITGTLILSACSIGEPSCMWGPAPMKSLARLKLVQWRDSSLSAVRSVTGAIATTALNTVGSSTADCSAAYPPNDPPTTASFDGSTPSCSSHRPASRTSPIADDQDRKPFFSNHSSPYPLELLKLGCSTAHPR